MTTGMNPADFSEHIGDLMFLFGTRKPRLCPPTGTRWLRMTEEETVSAGDRLATLTLEAAKAAILGELTDAIKRQNELRRQVAELRRTARFAQDVDHTGPRSYLLGSNQVEAVLARAELVLRDTTLAKTILAEVVSLTAPED